MGYRAGTANLEIILWRLWHAKVAVAETLRSDFLPDALAQSRKFQRLTGTTCRPVQTAGGRPLAILDGGVLAWSLEVNTAGRRFRESGALRLSDCGGDEDYAAGHLWRLLLGGRRMHFPSRDHAGGLSAVQALIVEVLNSRSRTSCYRIASQPVWANSGRTSPLRSCSSRIRNSIADAVADDGQALAGFQTDLQPEVA